MVWTTILRMFCDLDPEPPRAHHCPTHLRAPAGTPARPRGCLRVVFSTSRGPRALLVGCVGRLEHGILGAGTVGKQGNSALRAHVCDRLFRPAFCSRSVPPALAANTTAAISPKWVRAPIHPRSECSAPARRPCSAPRRDRGAAGRRSGRGSAPCSDAAPPWPARRTASRRRS